MWRRCTSWWRAAWWCAGPGIAQRAGDTQEGGVLRKPVPSAVTCGGLMVLNRVQVLSLVIKERIDGFDDTMFSTTNDMKWSRSEPLHLGPEPEGYQRGLEG